MNQSEIPVVPMPTILIVDDSLSYLAALLDRLERHGFMPPAFNLSQDQTLQFNLCLFGIAATVVSDGSLTQNTDRPLLA